jgi:hypothetical protein
LSAIRQFLLPVADAYKRLNVRLSMAGGYSITPLVVPKSNNLAYKRLKVRHLRD